MENLQSSRDAGRVKALKVSPLPGEHAVDDILEMTFADKGLSFLGREDVVFQGTSTLIAAREKGGKSTLARHLAHAWVIEGQKVLYISEEFVRVWKRQLEAFGMEKGSGYFQVIQGLGQDPEELLRRATYGPEDIVILDTATWLLGISLGNRDQVIEGLRPWVSLCSTGKSVVILGHLTKRDEIAGSHAFAAGVDTVITYREARETDLRVVEVKSISSPPSKAGNDVRPGPNSH
jgi:predicted ATP-dependent serine protease